MEWIVKIRSICAATVDEDEQGSRGPKILLSLAEDSVDFDPILFKRYDRIAWFRHLGLKSS